MRQGSVVALLLTCFFVLLCLLPAAATGPSGEAAPAIPERSAAPALLPTNAAEVRACVLYDLERVWLTVSLVLWN